MNTLKWNKHLCLNIGFFIKVTNHYNEFNIFNWSCSSSLHGTIQAGSLEKEVYPVWGVFSNAMTQNNRSGLGMVFRILPWKSNNICKISQPQTLTERERGPWCPFSKSKPTEEKCQGAARARAPRTPLSSCLPDPCVCSVLSVCVPWPALGNLMCSWLWEWITENRIPRKDWTCKYFILVQQDFWINIKLSFKTDNLDICWLWPQSTNNLSYFEPLFLKKK